jgi:hypothetical protein
VIGPETTLDPQSWPFAQIGQSWMVMAVEACSSWPRGAADIVPPGLQPGYGAC